MDEYPDMRAMARLATEDYSRIDSLEKIRPPYPAHGSPNWWALRLRLEELLAEKHRRAWKNALIATRMNVAEAQAAKWSALGNEYGEQVYAAMVPTWDNVQARSEQL